MAKIRQILFVVSWAYHYLCVANTVALDPDERKFFDAAVDALRNLLEVHSELPF